MVIMPMAAYCRKRFWSSLILTLPILALSPMLQSLVGLREAIRFPGDIYVLFGLSVPLVVAVSTGLAAKHSLLIDIVRPEAKQAITAFKAQGIRCLMLTGDNKARAKWVSEQIGLDEYFAEVLPQDKAAKVKEVQARGVPVAMTGDGVNDAPALGAVLMSANTVIVAINARMLKQKTKPKLQGEPSAEPKPAASVEVEAKVEPEPEAKVDASQPPAARQVVQRIHEFHEEPGGGDVRAVQA